MESQLQQLSKIVKDMRGTISQQRLGELLGVGQSAVSSWEAGKSMPRLDQIESIARYRGQLPEEFVAELYGRTIVTSESVLPIQIILSMSREDRIIALKTIAESL